MALKGITQPHSAPGSLADHLTKYPLPGHHAPESADQARDQQTRTALLASVYPGHSKSGRYSTKSTLTL
jgi:hypothetical protein